MKYIAISVLTAGLLVGAIVAGLMMPMPKTIKRMSSIPKLIYDYIGERDESIITIHGFDDFLYNNITVKINDTVYREEYIYSFSLKVNLTYFTVSAEVWTEDHGYRFDGVFIIGYDEMGNILITVLYTDSNMDLRTIEASEDDLPIKINLHEIVVEDMEVEA